MRALFVIFLLANVGLFYWQTQWRPAQPESRELPVESLPAGVARLQLLSEAPTDKARDDASRSETTETPTSDESVAVVTPGSLEQPALDEGTLKRVEETPAPAPTAPPVCYSLGPFRDKAKAATVREEFSKAGFEVTAREDVERTPRGYWIYLPAQKNYNDANAITESLQAKGIRDLFIMGKGEHQNAISLGLYRTKSAAEERYNQVKALGYAPEFEQQYRETPVTWLELTLPAEEASLATRLGELAGQYADARLTPKACE